MLFGSRFKFIGYVPTLRKSRAGPTIETLTKAHGVGKVPGLAAGEGRLEVGQTLPKTTHHS